jgi:predicted nucleic acid-binding protein
VGAQIIIVASDANPLINLIHVGRILLLGRLPGYQFNVPDDVVAEITDPEQRVCLDEAIAAGALTKCALTDPVGLTFFADLRRRLGAGESACLALARLEGWHVASDERRVFRRAIREHLGEGRLVTTPDIYVMAIRAGLITVAEADTDRAVLATRRFVMKGFESFAELLNSV